MEIYHKKVVYSVNLLQNSDIGHHIILSQCFFSLETQWLVAKLDHTFPPVLIESTWDTDNILILHTHNLT